ncbi:putative reverse transcriptase domain-containing protein [Tanacetum coccineum]
MIRLRAESPSTSHPLPLPSPIVLLHTRESVAMMRAAAPSTYILAPRLEILPSETPPSWTPQLLPIPLPTPSPPLLLPSIACRAGVSKVTLPPRKRLCIALGPRYEVGKSSSAPTARPTRGFRADYGFVGTLNDEIRRDPERERQDTDEIYGRLDDAQDDTSLMSGQLNILHRDRCAHARTAKLMETEARLSCDAWVQSMDASDTARSEVTALQSQAEDPTVPSTALDYREAGIIAPIDQGVANALAARDADRSRNGEDSHDSGTSVRRQAPSASETIGHDVAYAMTCTNLKKMMTNKYCPRGEIKKLEVEMWNLKVKESDKIEKYIGGLPDMIHRSVMASKPKTMQDAIEFTTELMDKKNRTFAERQRSGEKKPYGGSKPLCSKCNYHHDGQCAPKCYKCNRVGHLARDCRSTANANTANNQRGTRAAKVYAVGRAGTNPDSNVITGTFLLNNRYASVLFDTSVDRSFVSTAFSSQIDITPSTLDH